MALPQTFCDGTLMRELKYQSRAEKRTPDTVLMWGWKHKSLTPKFFTTLVGGVRGYHDCLATNPRRCCTLGNFINPCNSFRKAVFKILFRAGKILVNEQE